MRGATGAVPIGVLRVLAALVGTTVAVHRLAQGLGQRPDGPGQPSYLTSILDALVPGSAVVDAAGRTVLLAAPALAIALILGSVGAVVGRLLWPVRRQRWHGTPLGPASVIVLAVAVPGVAWLPLARMAIDRGLVPDDPAVVGQATGPAARFIGFWALLAGLAVLPTVAASFGQSPTWRGERATAGGHPALARVSSGSLVGPGGRFALSTLTFGLALATAEVASGHGGLFARFAEEEAGGRVELLLPLALLVTAGGLVLALGGDLADHFLNRPVEPAVMPAGRRSASARSSSPATAVGAVIALAVVWSIGALFGAWADPPPPAEAGLGPTIGGPWLGTDGAGHSLGFRAAAALGPGLVAALVPAAAATAIGAGLASALHRLPGSMVRPVDAALDVLAWPAALVVPLAAWSVADADPGQPLLSWSVLQATGLLLIPVATRLLGPAIGLGPARWVRTGAVALVLAAVALAVHLVAGLVGPPSADRWAPLGQLVGQGFAVSGLTWALVVPVGATILAMACLLGGSALLANQPIAVAHRPPSPVPARPGPARITPPTPRPQPARHARPTLEPPDGRESLDIRDEVRIDSAIDFDPERDATSTVELRPSDFHRPEDGRPGGG